ncbi:hypothetical protein [Klebsiella aerogenes]|uniref:hypothetical protein n=1 Tax=Klebsiella aerogenes TaxID=548 RepID=UPI003D31DE98
MLIVSVLRMSKEYQPLHVQWLHRQLVGYDSLCISDCEDIEGVKTAPLLYNFPSWWAKIEAFNPKHPIIGNKDILLFDIDTVITGDLTPFLQQKKFTTLTDFYYENLSFKPVGSAIMYIPYEIKSHVWSLFMQDPEKWIYKQSTPPYHGDQGFLSSCTTPARWQDVLPDYIISYKKNIAKKGMPGWNSGRSQGNGTLPKNARIVVFHGKPRPWEIDLEWVPRLIY